MVDVKTEALLVPPVKGERPPVAMKDGRPSAALVVAYQSRRVRLGQRVEVSPAGFSLGGCRSDFEVEGAASSGTRVRIEWSGGPGGGKSAWSVEAVGHAEVNGEPVSRSSLSSGDDVRVVDSYFRFLAGADVTEKYHETIYLLTIVDFPTRLNNARFLAEALEREQARAKKYSRSMALATVRFEHAHAGVSDNDLVFGATKELRARLHGDWVSARSGALEVAVIAPDASAEQLEQTLVGWLSRDVGPPERTTLGVAAWTVDEPGHRLLDRARAAAKRLPQP